MKHGYASASLEIPAMRTAALTRASLGNRIHVEEAEMLPIVLGGTKCEETKGSYSCCQASRPVFGESH
jgi:hypothetical protein